jgi:transcription elongation factor Elf1
LCDVVTLTMKGRITCPKCGEHIIAEMNREVPSFSLECPICNHRFTAKTSQVDVSNVDSDSPVDVESDCYWEEHGEPRKTILSAIKPRTDKPMIASFLLIGVVVIALVSSFFPTIFLQGPVGIASLSGLNGELTVFVDNTSALSIDNMTLSIDQENTTFTRKNDSFVATSLSLGEHVLTVSEKETNKSENMATKNVYILPFDFSTYTLKITDTNPLRLKNSSFELEWLSAILFILAILTLIGALMCWKRRFSDIALFGSIVGIFSIGLYFTGLVLAVIALWLILKSRDEFDDGKKGKSF